MKKVLLTAILAIVIGVSYSQEQAYQSGDLIVMLDKGIKPEKIINEFSEIHSEFTGIELERTLSPLSNIHLFHFDNEQFDEDRLLSMIRNSSYVRAAQFNHFVQDRATVPNDPSIASQWHHVDASDNDIDSDLAWDTTTGGQTLNGDDIVVCVIEGGGSNYNHVDLIDNHWTNPFEIEGNGVDDDGNGFIDDFNGWDPQTNTDNIGAGGHGTAVSGMIGAKGNNNNGGAGVNWDVKIMQVEIGSLNEANVIASYNYPYTLRNLYNTTNGANGAFVVATNASWGIDNANPSNYPVWCAYYDDLGAAGILNCGATANNNVNIDVVGDMPTGCGSDYMIAVTATNSSDVRTFSGYGATTIDLGAPGESVFLPSGSTGYSSTSGTSFASPCVAGAIALVYSAPCTDLATAALSAPGITADNVRGYILDGVDVVPALAGECVTGGRLNVNNSIDLALGSCGPLPSCDVVSMTLSGDCQYNPDTDAIEQTMTVDVEMSEAFCTATSICYQPAGGAETCIDLIALGVNLNNDATYTISGLMANTDYTVYYTTTDDTSASQVFTTGDCSSEVAGCTDAGAENYDASATIDDGSCTFACTDVTLTFATDCWGGEVSWQLVSDDTGETLASVASNTYGNESVFTWEGCLVNGCYTWLVQDSFGDGQAGQASGCAVDGSYSMTQDSDGSVLFEIDADPNYGSGTSHNFCVPTELPGCVDDTACNYNPAATTDDGSCEYTSCAGCTDSGACNYDATATIDDGSCESTSCAGCTDSGACNYDATATIDDGSCESTSCAGCTDSGACNYDATATIDDGSCESTSCAGCTDSGACNYDATATIDDGSCEFSSCNCAGDFNNNGVVEVADLLILLGEYGCTTGCTVDMDGDGFVGASDILNFLSVFGLACPE